MRWTQIYDPLGHWWLSTLVAGLPIIVLFGLLAGLKVKPHWCAIAGAIATAATEQVGNEGIIFRFVAWHSVALCSIVGIIVMLYAYVFRWAVPHGLTFVK